MQKLTIGIAHRNDYDGAYFTIQDIRKELIYNNKTYLLQNIEFIIVENEKDSVHGQTLNRVAKSNIPGVVIVNLDSEHGTSATRNKIIEEATGQFVLVMDCHVLLCPTAKIIEDLFTFMEYNKKTNDLYTGPLVYDNMRNISTHFNDEWGGEMWGKWGSAWQCGCESYNFAVLDKGDNKCKFVSLADQKEVKKCGYCNANFPQNLDYAGHERKLKEEGYLPIGYHPSSEPFEIFAQGLGLFFTRKNAWLGFNEHSRGFGGEECYIHEKYRQAGRKTICLPFLKWLHRFDRPEGMKYPLTVENKLRNYILEFVELDLDLKPLKQHFVVENNVSEQDWNTLVKEAYDLQKKEHNEGQSEKDLLEEIASLRSKLVNVQKNKKCCKS